MSKHKGNVVDPWEVLDKQGADAVRWYFYAAASPWLPKRFSGALVGEMQRKFMGTLWNTYAFFTLYASIDGYDPVKQKAKAEDFSLMDKWVLSKLQSLIRFVDEGLAEYKITETARAIAAFVDELSNWYVRRCRERFWGKGLEGDKLAAFETLYTVLTTLCSLCAPYIPFMTENMYQNLVVNNVPGAKESVHLTDFPKADMSLVDKELEDDMEAVIAIVQLGRACRSAANMKVRQPARALYVKGAKLPEAMAALIAGRTERQERGICRRRPRLPPATKSSRSCARSARATESCWARSAPTSPSRRQRRGGHLRLRRSADLRRGRRHRGAFPRGHAHRADAEERLHGRERGRSDRGAGHQPHPRTDRGGASCARSSPKFRPCARRRGMK